LAQLPSHIEHEGRHYALSFTRISRDGAPSGALLVTRDVTEELLAARAKVEQRERAQMFERLMRDQAGFAEFLSVSERLMHDIDAPGAEPDQAERKRALHTLKGLTAVFDVRSVSAAAHELERALGAGTPSEVAAAQRELSARWQKCLDMLRPVLEGVQRERIELSPAELRELAL